MGSNTDDDDDLRERIERIEKLVYPSRRDVLAGVAGGAATAGLLAGASGRSQAQATAGDVGEAQNPVDLYANNVYPPGGAGSGNSTNISSAAIEDASFTGPDGSVFNLFKHLVAHDPSVPETRYYDIEGLSNADKGAKLQTAMDSLPDFSWVYVPPGSYEGPITHKTHAQAVFSFGNQGATISNDSGHAFVVDYDSGNPYQGSVRNISASSSNAGNDAIHFIPPSSGGASNFDLINVHLKESGRHGLFVDSQNLVNLRMVGGQNSTVPGDFGGDLLNITCEESYFEIGLYGHSITIGSSTDVVGVYSRSTDPDNASITDNTDVTQDVKIRHANLNDWERLSLNLGETVLLEHYRHPNGSFAQAGQITQGVSTTATAILSRPAGNIHGNSVVVYGADGSMNEFTEQVLYQSYGSATSLGRVDRGTIPSTSYAADGPELDLTMGSGTWDVTALSTATRSF